MAVVNSQLRQLQRQRQRQRRRQGDRTGGVCSKRERARRITLAFVRLSLSIFPSLLCHSLPPSLSASLFSLPYSCGCCCSSTTRRTERERENKKESERAPEEEKRRAEDRVGACTGGVRKRETARPTVGIEEKEKGKCASQLTFPQIYQCSRYEFVCNRFHCYFLINRSATYYVIISFNVGIFRVNVYIVGYTQKLR